MRDLQKVFNDCINMMDKIGIDYGVITNVKVNTRAKTRWGQCCHDEFIGVDEHGKRKYKNSINISEVLLDERVPIEELQNTIIHEILHTCPGCDNHGSGWKRRAAKVKKELGFDIQRCGNDGDKCTKIAKEYIKPKYIVKCPSCGRTVERYRMCSIIKYPENWICGVCHSKFVRVI